MGTRTTCQARRARSPDPHTQLTTITQDEQESQYWATDYSWRAFEDRLNEIGQFRTTIGDLGIHFLHRRSARADAVPLILTHGWPGSVAEFAEWTDTEDSPFETISRDRLLDNVTLYWLTRTGASSARIYFESHDSLDPELRVDVPSAVTMYPLDIEKYPRAWSQERDRNIVRWRAAENGGHFPSLELPEHFITDVRQGLAAVLADTA